MAAEHCYFCGAPVRATAKHCVACGQSLLLQGRYRLAQVLGQGGFAVVYEATDTRLGRRCAIKVVGSASRAGQEQVAAEANILSQNATRFPFMPDIYDIWTERAQTFLVMEYIDGPTLDELLGTPWRPAQVTAFLRTLLSNLAELHAVGIVHRDLKPANIKRTPQGRFVLLDFGIAKQGTVTLPAARALSLDYGSPEQIRGQATDARSDLYSLGATAYHLVTGQPPLPAHVRLAHVALPAPSTLVPGIPPALETTILALLALDPAERPDHAAAALDLLGLPASVPATNGGQPLRPLNPSASPVAAAATRRLSQTTTSPGATFAPAPVVTSAGTSPAPVGASPSHPTSTPLRQPKEVRLTRRYDLRGGGVEVPAVAWSPDGEHLASGGADRIVRLWRTRDGAPLASLEGHTKTVTSLVWSPDGRLLVSGSLDGSVRIWWVAYNALLCALEEHESPVWSVAYAPDGESLVSGNAAAVLRIWQVADTRLLQRIGGHTGRIAALAYRHNGKVLASAGDTTVRLWQVGIDGVLQPGRDRQIVIAHGDMRGPRAHGVTGVAWSPNGELVASSGFGAESGTGVWLWSAVDGRLQTAFDGEVYGPASLAWSSDGALLVNGGGGSDGRVWLWDVNGRRRVATLRVSSPGALAFSPDGTTLAVGQAGGIQLWQIER